MREPGETTPDELKARWRALDEASERGDHSGWLPWREERKYKMRMAGSLWGPPSKDGNYVVTPTDHNRAKRTRAWLKAKLKSINDNPALPSNMDGNPATD